ncbi:hypothetical protein GCM10011344_06910 [Dokdonia pacifica]|uniref:Patatin-like phospholipase n=1 Tax=Dokdonia pacifica TaxID=1627892 RepID=A0A238Z0I4_9FLAO|nr:hypothetical protein [Dokdonia pacifica]GGG08942.1 hypothetical protein GCM10011344_06910 [Dokdonia pacifica]SNR76880.1 hypothetical protein SAMN06265376_102513 [Dokdonia pacifica]
MKKIRTVSFKKNVFPQFRNLALLFATLLFSISCDELTSDVKSKKNPEQIIEVETSPPDNIHVAFAGGGWRAHTAHTAWTQSLLENNGNKLENVFQHVQSIGSNSGGSWFSTMLVYSPKFVTNIETIPLNNWGNTMHGGWLGGQQNLFNKASFLDFGPYCSTVSGEAYTGCVLTYYAGKHIKWEEAIKSLVFKDYPLGSLTLNGTRQKWATDKSLLIASTMLTNNVVLNAAGGLSGIGYNQYYQACLHGAASTNGKHGGSCSNGVVPDVTPVTFSSINSPNLNLKSPPFFPELGTGKSISLSYSQVADHPNTVPATIKTDIRSDQVQVLHAAAASSAALGFAASKNISGGWDRSYAADNLALNFSLQNGIAQYNVADDGTSVSNLATTQRVSLADGGPTDNSGVAQLMSFLQLNNKDTNFNIVAFDNVQGPPFVPGENGAAVGSDIASLLGMDLCLDGKFCTGFNCDGVCVGVPELQIFESAPIENALTWSYPKQPSKYKNTPRLLYTKYKVTTTANSALGIKAGSTGYLHAFTCYYPDADTSPTNNKESFEAYQEMMKFINTGLKVNNNEGLLFLEKALGIK